MHPPGRPGRHVGQLHRRPEAGADHAAAHDRAGHHGTAGHGAAGHHHADHGPATTTPTTSPATTTPGSSAPSTSPSTAPPTTEETTPAPPPGPLTVTFALNGTTKLRKLGVEAPIGPGTLTAKLDLATGAVDGDLQLPPATPLKLKVLGLPLSANFGIEQVGRVTGSFVDGVVRTSAKANLKVSQLKLGRLTLLKGTCTTVKPVALDLASGPGFSPITGGTVSGTYTIPKFGGCGFIGMFVNLLVPGSGNTLSLTLTPKV